MAKKKKEEAPPAGAPAWMATFSDLMNLLLCFFVLLFSMSSVDESKAEAMIKSMADTFSIFQGGGESFEDGVLVSSGATQLSNLDEYYTTSGQTDDGDSIENVNSEKNGAGQDGKKDNIQENPGDHMNTGDSNKNPGQNPGDEQNPQAGDDSDKKAGDGTKDDTQTGENQDKDKNNGDIGEQTGQDDIDKSSEGGHDEQNPEGSGDNNDHKNAAIDDIDIEEIKKLAAAADLTENKEQSGLIYEEVVGLAEKFNISDYIDIAIDADSYQYVSIQINGTVLFDSGKDIIKDDAKAILSKLGDVLKQYRDYKIEVIGHTDNVPNGKNSDYPTNELLSSARAISVATFLAENKGIGWDNIYFAGRGEHEPIADNSTAEGRRLNRRVEIRLYNKKNSDN